MSDLDDSDGLEEKDNEQSTVEDTQQEKEKNSIVEEHEQNLEQKYLKETKEKEAREKAEKERQERESKTSLNMDDGEQLDFEAEDQPEVGNYNVHNYIRLNKTVFKLRLIKF